MKAFKARTGHCRVLKRYVENKALGRWVDTQCRQYKLMIVNKLSQMTLTRINTLNEIEFDWEVTSHSAHGK